VIEGTGRLRGSEPNLMSCRKNILHIIVGCITLCFSTGIYKVQESRDTNGSLQYIISILLTKYIDSLLYVIYSLPLGMQQQLQWE
jgi:hypothetical protein